MDTTQQKCKIDGCKAKFNNSYELGLHIAATHQLIPDAVDLADPNEPENILPPVIIRTTRKVEICLTGKRYEGMELSIPYQQAEDAKRILREAYERDGAPPILAE